MATLVWTSDSSHVTPAEHARRIARIASAGVAPPVIVCRQCGIERRAGTGCGEPCA